MMHNNKRVLVAMSGGIDSSAVCLMLQEQGYEVVGMTMRVYDLPRQFAEAKPTPTLSVRLANWPIGWASSTMWPMCARSFTKASWLISSANMKPDAHRTLAFAATVTLNSVSCANGPTVWTVHSWLPAIM